MERLTMKTKSTDGVVNLNATDETCIDICANMDGDCNRRCPINEAYKRLAAYEDLGTVEELAALKQAESEGRLYIASYKEGDTVYRINTNKRDQRYGVHEEQVTAVDVTVHVNGIIRPLEDLLPDREAAEAALAAMEGK